MIPARKVDDVTPSVYEYSRSSSNLVYIVLLCFDVFLCNCVFSCRIVEQLAKKYVHYQYVYSMGKNRENQELT